MRGFVFAGTIVASMATLAGCAGEERPDALEEELGAAAFSTADELSEHGELTARKAWSAVQELNFEEWTKDACPRLTVDGDTVTVEGGCTDAEGKVWTGRATRTGSIASRTFSGTFDELQIESTSTCEDGSTILAVDHLDGSGSAVDRGDGQVTFEIDVRHDHTVLDPGTCGVPGVESYVKRFAGSFRETGGDRGRAIEPDRIVWNGRGLLGDSDDGVAVVESIDVTVERARCDSEPLSGRTILTAGGHRAVLTHDGATDCDPTQTVTWTYDGRDMGEAEVPSCAVRRPGASGSVGSVALLLGAVALGALRLRRRGRSRGD